MKEELDRERVEALFHEALERSSNQREQFLRDACGSDNLLYAELVSLITHHSQTNTLLGRMEGLPDRFLAEIGKSESLEPGHRVGHYVIVKLLGRGGMGEVYLARDLHLQRKVALKVLPAHVAHDSVLIARLEREARTASQLNHPNIVTVHEFVREPDFCYLVTECVDGTTLRERLHSGPMPFPEACRVVSQLAAALTAAHKAGVIHRDIKPENVMLKPEGLLKVLDFGLAKNSILAGAADADLSDRLQCGTITVPGQVLGTVDYMSPEQVRGETLDARTDIWSSGVLLYELLTGQRPFSAGSTADTLAAILYREPEFAMLPKDLWPLLGRTLRKDREERCQTAQGLLEELECIEAQQHAVPARGAYRANARSPVGAIRRKALWVVSVATTAALALVMLEVYRLRDGNTFEVDRVERVTSSGNIQCAAISADGHYVAYGLGDTGAQELRVQQLGASGDLSRIPSKPGLISGLTFSPDNQYIYFVRQQGEFGNLFRVPILAGNAELVTEDVDSLPSFSPDGQKIAYVHSNSRTSDSFVLTQTIEPGAKKNIVASRHPPVYITDTAPTWSPDGKLMAFAEYKPKEQRSTAMIQLDVAKHQERAIGPGNWSMIGRPVWLAGGNNLLVPVLPAGQIDNSIHSLSLKTNKEKLLWVGSGSYGDLSATSDQQTLATIEVDRLSDIWVFPVTNARDAHRMQAQAGRFRGIAWDGNNHVISQASVYGQHDLWRLSLDGREMVPLTNDKSFEWDMVTTRDGRYLVFVSDRDGTPHLWRIDLSVDPEKRSPLRITDSANPESEPAISPDGRWVVFTSISADGVVSTMWQVPLLGGHAQQILHSSARGPAISPDGRWIACQYSRNNTDWSLALIPFHTKAELRVLKPVSMSYQLRWTPDGRGLTYIADNQNISNIWLQPLDGGSPKQISDFHENKIYAFDWSPDAQNIACVRGSTTSDAVLLHRKTH